MTEFDDIDFRELLERYLEEPLVSGITLTLLSGDKYSIGDRANLVLGKRVISIMSPRGGESFFPFEAICNIDVQMR